MKNRNWLTALWIAAAVLILAVIFSRVLLPLTPWVPILLSVLLGVDLVLLGYEYREGLRSRSTAVGLYNVVNILIVFGIVGVINFISQMYPQKLDLTKNKIHTLSDQTRKILHDLKKPVKASLFSSLQQQEKYRALLKNYQDQSTEFKVEYVDPFKEPSKVKLAGIKKENTLHLTYDGKTSLVEDLSEEKVTNALIKLLKDRKMTFCPLIGHGEQGFEAKEPNGFSYVKKGLEDQSYVVKEINLAQQLSIPADCDAIGIVGPTKAFFDAEIKVLDDYLANGGRALVALDIQLKGPEPSTSLLNILKKWYVDVLPALIVDPIARMQGSEATIPFLSLFSKESPITRDFVMPKDSSPFPFLRLLEILPNAPTDLSIKWLAKTNPTAWAEFDKTQLSSGQVRYDDGKDKRGQLIAALSVEGKLKDSKASRKTRLVVFGTSQFASNNLAQFGGNYDFFMNATSWLLEDESLISIRARDEEGGSLTLTEQHAQLIFWGLIVILPITIAVVGIVNWARRRRL